MKFRRFILRACQIGMLLGCAFIALRGYPPASAQERIAAKDAVQDEKLNTLSEAEKRIDEHLSHTDTTAQKLAEDISGIQAELRTIGSIVGILQVIQIVVGNKKYKPSATG